MPTTELGARPLDDGNTEFRVWAPRAESVAVRLPAGDVPLAPAEHGLFEGVAQARPGDDYWFALDGTALPDPASRWQPEGLRGPSRVVEPLRLERFDTPSLDELVLYELHVGTFSPDGMFEDAIPYLRELAELGITAIEIMPVAEFPGARGWGYDGVYLSAAQSSYGGPEGLVRMVAAAHEAGLAVVLDVVYNHVGTSGVKALDAFGPYFTDKYETPWGRAINYDDADSDYVREWVLQSAVQWVRDFAIDGLRLDAIHAIVDTSAEHIVEAIARRVHAENPRALVIAESGLNDPRVMRPRERGGYECDAAWADDFHHALRVPLTDDTDAYYADFGRIAQLAKAFHRPHVHDGGYSGYRRRHFGAPAEDVPPKRFVVYCQDHDQVGNRAYGDRLPEHARRLAAFCTLLSPFTPMLFMGEEYGERAPFQFFSDHIDKRIAKATREGRRREFAAFAGFTGEEVPDPQDRATFEASRLTGKGPRGHEQLVRELLAARRELGGAEAQVEEYDERAKWLRVRRGPFELLMNFGRAQAIPTRSREVVVTTGTANVQDDGVRLGAMTGALVR